MVIQVVSPILCILAQYGLATVLMATTTRSPFYMAFGIFISVSLLYVEISMLPGLYHQQLLESPHAFFSLIRTVHIIHLLCFLGVDKHAIERMRAGDSSKFLPAARLALRLATTTRGIGTIWEVKKNTPTFPTCLFAKNGQISWGRFLLRQTAILSWQYLSIDLFYNGYFAKFYEIQTYTHGPRTELMIYKDPTFTQLAARLIIVLLSAMTLRTLLDLTYRCFSVVFVGTCLTSPEEWPPLFGSIQDAYTFRRFWGQVWHQLLRWPLQNMSRVISANILGLPPNTTPAQYSELILIFTLSAALHYIIGVWTSTPGLSGLSFLLTITPMIIMAEYWILAYIRNTENTLLLQLRRRSTFCKVIGYFWVLLCLYVTGPWSAFPIMRLPVHGIALIPYSMVGNFGLIAATLNAGVLGLLLHCVFKLEL